MRQIEFKSLSPLAKLPSLATPHSAGFDLSSTADYCIESGQTVMVQTGLALSIPIGYVGLICPRSGLASKFGITVANAPGVIDADYRGEVCVLLHNRSENKFNVYVGDRIAQMVLTSVPTDLEFCLVVELDETERGGGGFGSSGIKSITT